MTRYQIITCLRNTRAIREWWKPWQREQNIRMLQADLVALRLARIA